VPHGVMVSSFQTILERPKSAILTRPIPLGCVLYTLLCGFPPFYDESIHVLTEKVAKGYYTSSLTISGAV
jgi:serine/threonine protein kinase